MFGNDLFLESWVVTAAYFNPFPTAAAVYPETVVQPYSAFVSVSGVGGGGRGREGGAGGQGTGTLGFLSYLGGPRLTSPS